MIGGIEGVSVNHSHNESSMRKLVGRTWEEMEAKADELKVREMGGKRRQENFYIRRTEYQMRSGTKTKSPTFSFYLGLKNIILDFIC